MSVDIRDERHPCVPVVLANGRMQVGPATSRAAFVAWVADLRADPDRLLESDQGPYPARTLLERYIDTDRVDHLSADDVQGALQRHGWTTTTQEAEPHGTNIHLPAQLVAGVVRHREPKPAHVHLPGEELAVAILPNSCYAWVSGDADVQELRMLLEQVLKVLAGKEAES